MSPSGRRLLLACLLLSCCAPDRPSGIIVADAPGADRANGRHFIIPFAVAANQRSLVNQWFSLNGDCSLRQYVSVRLLTPPRHGTFTIERGRFVPGPFFGSSPRTCAALPRDGVAAFFEPAPGYVGPDLATILVIRPDGRSWTTDFRLAVR